VGLNSLKSLNLTNVYPNNNNKNKKKKNNNKVNSKPLELFELAGKNQCRVALIELLDLSGIAVGNVGDRGTDLFNKYWHLASKVFFFNHVSFKSKFRQYQCKRCLVQSGAGSRFFVAEKNCSTFWIFLLALTVSISLSQQLQVHGKSYYWTNFFIQPPETQKTPN
jgi:hypothetical protein